MPQTFYERLEKYFSDIGKVLRGEADSASIFPNATDIGMSRERVYAEVLRLHVPSSCNVSYGGFIFDIEGRESRQMDVVISNDKALQFNFHNRDGSGKSFACIDGCIAVVSIKSTLDTAQLTEALSNIASLPDKSPLGNRLNPMARINDYEDWPYKIVFASNGMSPGSARKAIEDFYTNNSSIPRAKRADLIHVAGKYVCIRVPAGGGVTRDGTHLEGDTYHFQTEHPDEYGIPYAVISIQEIAMASSQLVYGYRDILNRLPLT